MAHINKKGKSLYDVIESVNEALLSDGYELAYSHNNLKGRLFHGLWKNDKIFIQLRIDLSTENVMILDCPTGVDTMLMPWEQVGSIQQWLKIKNSKERKKQPIIIQDYGELFNYWIFSNKNRLVIIIRNAIEYESAYVGRIETKVPLNQYAYPVYIGASALYEKNIGLGNKTMLNCGYLRKPDGQWTTLEDVIHESDTGSKLFPMNTCRKGFVNKPSTVLEIMLPFSKTSYMAGFLIDVYAPSSRVDLCSEDIYKFREEEYILFHLRNYRTVDEYVLIRR